jgi:hypothetical protein
MSHDFTQLDMIKIELAAKYHAKIQKAGNFLVLSEVINDLIDEAVAAAPSPKVTDREAILKMIEEEIGRVQKTYDEVGNDIQYWALVALKEFRSRIESLKTTEK